LYQQYLDGSILGGRIVPIAILNGNQFDPLVLFLQVNQIVYKSLTNNKRQTVFKFTT